MAQKIEPVKKFYLAQVDRDLRKPLSTIASAMDVEVRTLTSQILRRFVSARLQLLENLAKNNGEEQKTQA